MRITGEMVIHRSRLETQLALLNAKDNLGGVQEVSIGLGRSLRELREAIMRVRLIPVAEIFARMPFVVRDLSRQTQKKVRLKLAGESTEIDKYLIERLKDPLLHLVRNAFSHGVETPAERIAAGKPEEATIELSAATAGDSVVIEVRDDGRGINPNAILHRARKLGLETPETLDNDSLLKILCSSGFSTRDDADLTSGRGVGMAVVHSTVRELGGNLTLDSEEGRGTCFTIRLPLTTGHRGNFNRFRSGTNLRGASKLYSRNPAEDGSGPSDCQSSRNRFLSGRRVARHSPGRFFWDWTAIQTPNCISWSSFPIEAVSAF